MDVSLHAASVPVFRQFLDSLQHILAKGGSRATAAKIPPSELLEARLSPDMFPLRRQVQIACDFAKGACARLAGAEVPVYPHVEEPFEALTARIAKTLAFIDTLDPRRIDEGAHRMITLKPGQDGFDQAGPEPMRGDVYLLRFAVPQFLFHVVTAYAILRHHGVNVGKADYLGDFRRQ